MEKSDQFGIMSYKDVSSKDTIEAFAAFINKHPENNFDFYDINKTTFLVLISFNEEQKKIYSELNYTQSESRAKINKENILLEDSPAKKTSHKIETILKKISHHKINVEVDRFWFRVIYQPDKSTSEIAMKVYNLQKRRDDVFTEQRSRLERKKIQEEIKAERNVITDNNGEIVPGKKKHQVDWDNYGKQYESGQKGISEIARELNVAYAVVRYHFVKRKLLRG